MVPLCNSILLEAFAFLAEIHESKSLTDLRARIIAGLGKLIPCDRVSFNELDLSAGRHNIVPTPEPVWWPRLGNVYRKHMIEHPLIWQGAESEIHRPVSFDAPILGNTWKHSVLYNEYFLKLGVCHHLAVLFQKN